MGAMAEQTVIDTRRSIVLPDDSDPIAVAAAMNPAMSSWIALRQRVPFQAGQNVLVLGATGNAGQLAVQVARLLGADQIIARRARATGGWPACPPSAPPTPCSLDGDACPSPGGSARPPPTSTSCIDYLWGQPTADAMVAVVTGRADRGQPLTWIEIGSVAGPTAPIPSAALRAARLQIVGSGQGSVSTREILAELPALAEQITSGTLPTSTRGPCRSPTSSRPGPTPPAPPSASSSPRSPSAHTWA